MKRLLLFCMLVLAGVVAGCATPEPRKIDTTSIPVQRSLGPATPGSIWPGETSINNLFQDFRARNVGDVLTVVISEKTSATKEATTSTSRDSSMELAISKLLGVPLNMKMTNFLGTGKAFSPEVESDYAADFDGSGKTKRSGSFNATITVRVVEVLPNGNLVVEGKKESLLNNELQYIVLSGIVRPADISTDNTILSTYVSDARLEYSGKGILSDEQKPGWLRRALDNVWPF